VEPSAAIVERVAHAAGSRPVAWEPVARGATPARRWLVKLARGNTAFMKLAADARTAAWLRDEYRVYSQLDREFLPDLVGWDDDGSHPLLLLEDLSHAFWPPPWSDATIEAVWSGLRELRSTRPPEGLPRLEDAWRNFEGEGWKSVAEDPAPFLALGLCSPAWLDVALPTLLEAAGDAVLSGNALVHFDVRSDNLCISRGRAVFVDWNLACVGNPVADVVAWLPSLHAEGGPPPDALAPDGAAELATLVTGRFAANAGLPPIPRAPRVRPLQLMQLRVALPWTARLLGLPPPG
jgi:phosphotransferase family enzyme